MMRKTAKIKLSSYLYLIFITAQLKVGQVLDSKIFWTFLGQHFKLEMGWDWSEFVKCPNLTPLVYTCDVEKRLSRRFNVALLTHSLFHSSPSYRWRRSDGKRSKVTTACKITAALVFAFYLAGSETIINY